MWELYRIALERFGAVSTMIERDGNIPEFPALEQELQIARDIADKTLPELASQLASINRQAQKQSSKTGVFDDES